MAAPYLNASKTWLICTPIMPPNYVERFVADRIVGAGSALAVQVSQIIAMTDIVQNFNQDGSPVMVPGGIYIKVTECGWIPIEGTRQQVSALLGLG